VPPSSSVPEAVARAAGRLAPAPVRRIEELRQGGNSRIFKITTAADAYALKQYPVDDRRDRQGAEARALAFFARAKLGRTPRLLAADRDAHVSLLSWIEGAAPTQISDADVAQFAQFQIDLDRAVDADARREIGPAAEACVSGERILSHIRGRWGALAAFGTQLPALDALLKTRFVPALDGAENRARRVYENLGLDFAADRPAAAQTLIASDFGAHNALRRTDGTLTFLDFEYFGWDDPLTSVGNFVLHPGMQLAQAQRALYRDALLAHFGAAHAERLQALLPLFALRWCAIVLSELLPERRAHRSRATAPPAEWEEMLARQFALANALLDHVDFA
jgi:phosphotransferase family enzyme